MDKEALVWCEPDRTCVYVEKLQGGSTYLEVTYGSEVAMAKLTPKRARKLAEVLLKYADKAPR